MSLRTRIKFYRRTDVKMTLWYILTFLVSALIICGFLYLRLRHQLIKEVDRFIHDETKELAAVFSRTPKETDFFTRFEEDVMKRDYFPFYFQILDPSGGPFFISRGFREMGYKPKDQMWVNARNGKETQEIIESPNRRTPYRIISTPIYADGKLTHVLQVGTHLHYVRKSLSAFKRNILAALPIILVLGSLGGWVLARRSLSPIGYIASKTQSITSQNLGQRLTPRGTDDEMDHLIRTINEMIARLEESFKRMSEFTADASHELKTPICALKGEGEVLLSRARTAEEYQEGLAHFIERFDQLNRMINDLILLSKSDASEAELRLVPVRLDLLIKDIDDLFQVLADQKNVALKMDPLQETVVMGDKMRLQQLFTNLIDNAVKFTPEKGSIWIRLEKNKGFVQVKVRDTGTGIPKGEQENIFKRFYRVDKSRSKDTGGVGLGLSIVDWIVKAHHGKIEVESELNHGSTFTVSLPDQNV